MHLQVSMATDELVATRVKPKRAMSEARRRKALKAIHGKRKVDDALKGVDAQMLELLSEHFLYPDSMSAMDASKARPKGRPEFVPGAMNYETMLKFRERQEVIDVYGKGDSTISAYGSPAPSLGAHKAPHSTSFSKTKGVRGLKGAHAAAATTTANENQGVTPGKHDAEPAGPKRRKRVVKSLPKPRSKTDKGRKASSRKRTKGSNLELHKYYRTELLSAAEEYSLGMKIQFMVKCEHVHEGLATDLMRLPSIQEWADACG